MSFASELSKGEQICRLTIENRRLNEELVLDKKTQVKHFTRLVIEIELAKEKNSALQRELYFLL